jgi:hypothetical protein
LKHHYIKNIRRFVILGYFVISRWKIREIMMSGGDKFEKAAKKWYTLITDISIGMT